MHSAFIPNSNNLIIPVALLELIITAGGENVPPVLIENAVKAELPFISNIMVIGDRKKFLSALITMQVSVNYFIKFHSYYLCYFLHSNSVKNIGSLTLYLCC